MLVGLAVFCTSAAVLGYEVLLMKLLTITQWHHFAYMIISLALLGFGASGTFIALLQKRLKERFRLTFSINAVLFSRALILSFVASEHVPLNSLEVLWDRRQWLYLLE